MKGTPESFEWYVHLYDQDQKLLQPIFPESVDAGDLRIFRPGDGVVGTAFVRRQVVVASEDAVADDSYRLSPEQQDYFAGYRRVVAAPLEWAGDVLGTLSAISVEADDYFETDYGPAVLRDAAGVVATVLVTMVGAGELGR
jgi:hypothetical protein